MLLASVALLGMVLLYSLFSLYKFGAWVGIREENGNLGVLLSVFFLLVLILYCFPLPIRLMQDGVEYSDVYRDVAEFIEYMPLAIILVSMFVLIFVVVFKATYVALYNYRYSITNSTQVYSRTNFKILWFSFLFVATILLLKLAVESGGLYSLILSGYSVTSVLSVSTGYAVAFSWMVTLSLLAFAYGLINHSKSWTIFGMSMIILCMLSFFIMGRRGALVVLSLALIIVHALCNKRLSYFTYITIVSLGFLALNLIGLLRGASYDSLSTFYESTVDRYNYVSEISEVGFFYTITDGNFVIPFQTLPNIISKLNYVGDFSYGTVTLNSLLLMVPSFIWSDRPLPLANWYMMEFVDPNAALNEGRQFFFLSESYLNFGPLGILFWGFGYGFIFAGLASYFHRNRSSYIHVVLFALILGNMLNFVASDTVGGVIAFCKNYGFPCLLMLAFSYVLGIRNRFNAR
jgi:oligosaccharide repeat unit polymerase